MSIVRFHYPDAAILYCIPLCGTKLPDLIWSYTSFDRVAIPTYEVIAACLSRATRAGVMRPPVDAFCQLNLRWYCRAHRWDWSIKPAECAMIEFCDWLESREWPELESMDYKLPEAAYSAAREFAQHRLDALFSRSERQ